MTFKLLIGCYTTEKNPYGLHLLEYEDTTNQLKLHKSLEVNNASYFVYCTSHGILYSVNEGHTHDDKLEGYKFNSQNNSFELFDDLSIGGTDPCHISFNNTWHHLFISNYSSGGLVCIPLENDGSFKRSLQRLTFTHLGPSESKSHVHSSNLSPDRRFLIVTDLGLDLLLSLRYEESEKINPLQMNPYSIYVMPKGTGPRHLVFSKDGRFAYVVGELDATLHVLAYHEGRFEFAQTLNLMEEKFTGQNSAAEIKICVSGEYLYISNRGDANCIVIFKVDILTGLATLIHRVSSAGIWPRNFDLKYNSEKLFLVNQVSNDIVIYKVHKGVPYISKIESFPDIISPVFVKVLD